MNRAYTRWSLPRLMAVVLLAGIMAGIMAAVPDRALAHPASFGDSTTTVLLVYGDVHEQDGVTPWPAGNLLHVTNRRTGTTVSCVVGAVQFGTYGLAFLDFGNNAAAAFGDTLDFDLDGHPGVVDPAGHGLTLEEIGAKRTQIDLIFHTEQEPEQAPEGSGSTALLLSAWPNPLTVGPATLTFRVFGTTGWEGPFEPVELSIHRCDGRRVRLLVDADYPPGQHRVSWDGRDALGRPAEAGVYLVRLRVGPVSARERLLVIR
jgi:hypothetical protein